MPCMQPTLIWDLYLVILRTYSYLSAQGPLLEVLGGSYMVPKIALGAGPYKADV